MIYEIKILILLITRLQKKHTKNMVDPSLNCPGPLQRQTNELNNEEYDEGIPSRNSITRSSSSRRTCRR